MDFIDFITSLFKVIIIVWVVSTALVWITGNDPLETVLKEQRDYIVENLPILEKNK